MKKVRFLVVCALVLVVGFCTSAFAAEPEGNFSYYDTADVSYGSFVLPGIYDNYVFYGEVLDADKTVVLTLDADAFSHTINESDTNLFVFSSEVLEEGEYIFSLTAESVSAGESESFCIPFEYGVKRPTTVLSEIPAGQGQYRIFFEDLLLADSVALEVSMLNESLEMVATTYLDFSSENLVGSMLTKTPSGVPGYSLIEMVTLFQTGAIVPGDYQLYFNLNGKLTSYQDTCQLHVVDAPIIHSVTSVSSEDLMYGENNLLPMISGSSCFDLIVTGFQIDPQKLSATLYNQEGERVAKSDSYLYHDTLLLGYGTINGYQKESGIQALVLRMNVSSSAILSENETYRVALSYDDSRLYGRRERFCTPESGLFVVSAEPFDVSSISLTVVNADESASYDIYLQDDAYGELYCGTFAIPNDGVLNIEVGISLTNGLGMMMGSDGTYAQFLYRNELLGLFIPQEVRVNPVVLHPTTTEYVAHFEMKNFSLSESTAIDVQLVKFAERVNGAYIAFDSPYSVAHSTDVKSVVRSKQDGYYNTDLLVELKVTNALDENALYSYLLNIDGHEINLIDQGEAYIVQVVNNTIYQAEILDRTLLGGIPVMQDELYFWCNGVVVRDASSLRFELVDENGDVVATMPQNALTPLSAEAEKQFCGKLEILSPLQVGGAYRLVGKYGNDTLYISEEYIGSDEQFGTVLIREDMTVSAGESEFTVFSQLINIPVEKIQFEIIDLLDPFVQPEITFIRTSYNYDTYYQWKHQLKLSSPLHEGVYKIVLSYNGESVADAMLCVSARTTIKAIEMDFDNGTIEGYRVFLENHQSDTSYGLLFGRSSVFSDALIIYDKEPSDGLIYLRKEELNALAVGKYDVFLMQKGIPTSGYSFYYSPFSTPFEVVDGNVIDGELDAGEKLITVSFSQPLNINTVSAETVQLLDSDGVSVPIAVTTSEERYDLFVRPQVGLHAEAQYTLMLTTALHGIYHGQMEKDFMFNFSARDGDQEKTDFFVPANQATEIHTDDSYYLSFLEESFGEDALLGIWREDVSVDLSGFEGLHQESFVVVVTDYQDDARFERAALLAFTDRTLPEGKSFVLLRYNPKTERFQQEGKSIYSDGIVYTPISGCGRYVLCISDAIPFTDVTGTWAEEYVEALWHQGIVSGYDKVTFGTDYYITRSEFIKMFVNALGLKPLSPQEYNLSLFRDYGQIEEWALPFWSAAYQFNIIKGTSENTLSPNDYITRSEIVTIIARAKLLSSTEDLNFVDAEDIPVWAEPYFGVICELGILTGYPDGSIRPNSCATRAETAKIICSLLSLE